MNVTGLFKAQGGRRYLKDYIRLIIGFLGCLMVIAIYQQLRLYGQGVLDSMFNQNLFNLWMHHLGFASLTALILAPVFGALEQWKSGFGFRACVALLMALLFNELLLTEYYLQEYVLPGLELSGIYGRQNAAELLTVLLVGGIVLVTTFRMVYQRSKRFYRIIGKMFPITLILLSLFLATLLSEKRPVNLNKNQYLLSEVYRKWVGTETYKGTDPYPFWRKQGTEDSFGEYLHWTEDPPNIVMIAVEGLNSSFVGEDAPYAAFMPYLNTLRKESLYWPNTIANAADSEQAFTVLTGSLPQGSQGFTHQEPLPNRWTLFSLLKKSGYRTSFQYGGNAALPGWDRLVYEERVDEVIDQKAFGSSYEKQESDVAGISLGYPDHLLYDRYIRSRVEDDQPDFDYFQTISSKAPFNYPQKEDFQDKAEEIRSRLELTSRERRVLKKNDELAGALLYADESLRSFFKAVRQREAFAKTIFVLIGTHHPNSLATSGELQSRTVPMMIYSPLLNKTGKMQGITTQLDLAPAILNSLSQRYEMPVSEKAAWLGEGFSKDGKRTADRPSPLYKAQGGAYAWIVGDALVEKKRMRAISAEATLLEATETPKEIRDLISGFEARESYVLENNALIPNETVLFEKLILPPSKTELVWIHSVFNGKDYDGAYETARDLAFSGQRDRAKLLCRYILMQVPGHVDSEILLGRIHAWEKEYARAIEILEQVVQKHPVYEDGYAALLDVYFWSGQSEKAQFLWPVIREHLKSHPALEGKLRRAGIQTDTAAADNRSMSQQIVQIHFE